MHLKRLTGSLLVLLLLVTNSLALLAQERTVSGVITDDKDGNALSGATVRVKNGTQTAVSDAAGKFTIKVPSGESILVISYTGYNPYEAKARFGKSLSVSLKSMDNQMDDVVIVGYGAQKRSNVIGAVSTINPRQVEDLPVANLSTVLKNMVPGLAVSQTAGKPGATTNVTIRSANSFANGGNTSPLYVIDGVVENVASGGSIDATGKMAFDNLDPTQVESITILKDAAATIYGARGSNGVILVTTKKGKAGKPRISYAGSYSSESAASTPRMLSGYDQALLLNNWVQNYTTDPGKIKTTEIYTPEELAYIKANDNDWFGHTWQNAHNQKHTLNVSGGSDKITYFAGGNYYNESGNIKGLYAKKYGFRAGMSAKIMTGLTADIVFSTDNSDQKRPSTKTVTDQSDQLNATVGGLLHVPHWMPIYLDGQAVYNNNLKWHPDALINTGSYAKNNSQSTTVNATLTYAVPSIPGLTFKGQFAQGARSTFSKEYYAPYTITDFKTTGNHKGLSPGSNTPTGTQNVVYTTDVSSVKVIPNDNKLTETYDGTKNWLASESVNYTKTFGNHSLNVLVGAEQSQTQGDYFRSIKGIQQIPDVDQYFGFSADLGSNSSSINGQSASTGRVSYFGRLNYALMDKYLLEAAFRADASPNFPVTDQWGYFPSVGLGWKISEEKFFAEHIKFFNDLKIRFNIGLTGSDATSAFAYKTRYTSSPGILLGTSQNGGLNNSNVPNPHITWSSALFKDLGFDGTFLERRFNFSIDFYHKHQFDMLETPNSVVPNTFGDKIADQNHGILNNWGAEAALGYNGSVGKDFTYNIGVNFSIDDDKVIQRYYNIGTDTGYNKPIGVRSDRGITGYQSTGIVRTQSEVDAWYGKHQGWTINGDSLRVGDLNFVDNNGDGQITSIDQTRIAKRSGNIASMGFNLGAAWKGLRFSTNIALNLGGSLTDKSGDIAIPTKDLNALAMWNDSYTAANPSASLPAIYSPLVTSTSTFWLHSATMLRINTMQLSYSLPQQLMRKLRLPECRFYLTGFNLWTIINPTPYKDPETNAFADYPILRSYTFGLNLSL